MKKLIAAVGLIAALALTGCFPVNVTKPVAEVPVEEVPPANTESTPEPEPEPELTMGQQNAVKKAESYLSVMAFSRQGLIEQLMYNEYPEADATFAVDYINPDWNMEAAEKAQSYLDSMAFSRQGLIDQLIYNGFTPEQAEYGATAVGY